MKHWLSPSLLMLCAPLLIAQELPTDNPIANYKLQWGDQIQWANVVNIKKFKGNNYNEKFTAAQEALANKEGGVVYFPAGTYKFADHLKIKNAIIIRGATSKHINAHKENFNPPTRFEFPKYIPKLSGNGTPIDTAFKGIHLENPASDSNCGIVNVSINRGHIHFTEAEGHKCGSNRIVIGCVLRNAAVADPNVPSKKYGQHPWQRFTQRHHAAVHVKAQENILIANNRLPKSGDDNFLQKGYILRGRRNAKVVIDNGVTFDYDNRPGLYINDFGIGGPGGKGKAGTPKTHPWGFRKGTVIRDNYIYCSGRCAIAFCGDGVQCINNVVRFPKGLRRYTTTGINEAGGSSTNDNRAVQMRGYRWRVEGTDFVVHSNMAGDSNYRINDGEGLMHEAHVNSAIKDSKLINNTGNAYISLYRVHGIEGLVVRGNKIHSKGRLPAIFALSGYFEQKFPCRNVLIENNVTRNSGILIQGDPAENNIVRNNRHIGPGGIIINRANAKLSGNKNYKVKPE